MITWETPREDSGDKWIVAMTYNDLLDNIVWILDGNDGQVQLATNPKLHKAWCAGKDITRTTQEDIKRRLQHA